MSALNSRVLYLGSNRELKFIHEDGQFILPDLKNGEVLARILLAAVCERDIELAGEGVAHPHHPHPPCVLGHEAVAEVIQTRRPSLDLQPGQRIVFSLSDSCLKCDFCHQDQRQFCVHKKKYGEGSMSQEGDLTGAFGTFIMLAPGTSIVSLPNEITDRVATMANCSLSVALAAVSMTPGYDGPILVQGATLIGLCVCAALKHQGRDPIYCTDEDIHKVLKAQPFGATIIHTALPAFKDTSTISEGSICCVIDTLGTLDSLKKTLHYLRPGGLHVIVGRHRSFGSASVPQRYIMDKALTVKGIKDPCPSDLQKAVDFLKSTKDIYPYESLLAPNTIPLKDLPKVIQNIQQDHHRLLVKP